MFFPVPRAAPLAEAVLALGLAAGVAWEVTREFRHPLPPPAAQPDRLQKALASEEDLFKTQLPPLRLSFFTFNVDGRPPAALRSGSRANQTFLEDFLSSVDASDLIHFGLQEVIELSNKTLEVETKLFATQTRDVSPAYDNWKELLVDAVEAHFGGGVWTLVGEEKLVGLYSLIFARRPIAKDLRNAHFCRVKTGMRDKLGNKGALAFRFTLADSSFCLINNHLAAGEGKEMERERDVWEVLDRASFPRVKGGVAQGTFEEGREGRRVLEHEFVFFAGDLNSHLSLVNREQVLKELASPSPELDSLLDKDEILCALSTPSSPLASFFEQGINFSPTYKYDHSTSAYDTSYKQRTPAWCDRVLWRARGGKVRPLGYGRLEPDVSDHRPVVASFDCAIKRVDEDALGRVMGELEGELAGGGRVQ